MPVISILQLITTINYIYKTNQGTHHAKQAPGRTHVDGGFGQNDA